MPDDWKTIRVPKGVYEDAKERKEEHNVTWGEYVNPHAWHSVFDEPAEDVRGEIQTTSEAQPTGVDAELQADIETIVKTMKTIEERTGQINRTLEGLQR